MPIERPFKEGADFAHLEDVIRRRAVFELEKSEDRAHVLEGLLTALDHIDRVIELIRASTSPRAAADRLCAEFGLSQRQAEAILAMRLARLTQLERKKLIGRLFGVVLGHELEAGHARHGLDEIGHAAGDLKDDHPIQFLPRHATRALQRIRIDPDAGDEPARDV